MSEIDKLQKMLDIQMEFQIKYNYDPPIHDRASAIMAEAGELWAISGGKWWKKNLENSETWGHLHEADLNYLNENYFYPLEKQNRDKIIEESIDVWHFLLTVWNRLGLSADQVFEAYTKKMGINKNRQETGY